MTKKSEKMALPEAENKAPKEFAEEIRQMIKNREFLDEKEEFSPMTRKYAEKSQTTEDDGWDIMTRKIVDVLPKYLTDGIVTCSLEKIGQEGPCRDAAEKNQDELTISPGDNFPNITFPTFYPYLDFILRAGPVDICHMKKYFKVEGSMKLDNTKVRFRERRVSKVSGTILVSAKISLCKGDLVVKLHEFQKKIEVA
ncbi:MAG: hypothetical protein MUF37_05750 [Methanoregulaceae archaeon]|jgi:hypothetical protein|nr:hypothetical protein [Methanoregulaceae archaeon]